jgi:hypothetical protein
MGKSEPKKIGRPKTGKRSDPDYRQVSAWIKRSTYDAVSKALIDQDRREFSELVQAFLEDWLQTLNPKGSRPKRVT